MSEDILARHERDGELSGSKAGFFCNVCSTALGQQPLPHLQGANHISAIFMLTLSQPTRYWARYRDIPERIRTALEKGEIVCKDKKAMCTICDVPLLKEKTVKDHLLSSIHVTKVDSRALSPLSFDSLSLGQGAPSIPVKRTKSIVTDALRNGHVKMVQEVGIDGFRCIICGTATMITGDTPLQQHLVGKTHFINAMMHELLLLEPSGALATYRQPLSPPSRNVKQEAGAGAPPAPSGTFYKNNSSPRGIVVIFNYIFRNTSGNFRKGARKDDENLSAVFTMMGYDVWPINIDLTRQTTLDKLDEVRNSSRLKHVDSLITIFLSHGGSSEDEFQTLDEPITVDEIIYTKFTDQECPHMKGKPKLFIFNYCRGSIKPSNPVQYDNWKPKTDNLEAPEDVAIIHATLKYYKAGRYTDTGTIFVHEFCNVLKHNFRNMDLAEIMHETSTQMIKDPHGNKPITSLIHFRKFMFA